VASNTGITLYGRLDETIMNSKYSSVSEPSGVPSARTAGEIKKGDIYSPGNAIGVRGREDLGGGTARGFSSKPERGRTGVWTPRRARVLISAAGTRYRRFERTGRHHAGIWDTPYKTDHVHVELAHLGGFSSGGIIMGNGDTTGALNNVLCTNTVSNASGSLASTAANSVCVTESTANNTAFSRRVNNSIQYWSPVFSGLQFKLMTAMANYKGSTNNNNFPNGVPSPKEYSGNITWARGPISLGLGADMHQGLRAKHGRRRKARYQGYRRDARRQVEFRHRRSRCGIREDQLRRQLRHRSEHQDGCTLVRCKRQVSTWAPARCGRATPTISRAARAQ